MLKLNRASIICFSAYLVATICFHFFYVLNKESYNVPFTHNENVHPLIVTFDVIGYAVAAVSNELGLWLRFIFFSLLIQLGFLIVLKLVLRFSIQRLILLIIVTLSFSFIIYFLLHPILLWIFGFYFSIIATLFIITFFVVHWEGLFIVEE